MPTHFRTGVSNCIPGQPLYQYGMSDPMKWITYFNDWLVYTAADWTITNTGSPTSVGISTSAGAAGGWFAATTSAASGDNTFYDLKGEAFRWSSTKKMFFVCRLKGSVVATTDIFCGLQITDTTPLDVTDGLFFIKATGAATVSFRAEKNDTATATNVGTMVDDTFMELAFFYDPRDGLFHLFRDGAEVAQSVSTNAVDDEDLTVSFGIQTNSANARTLTVDYIFAAQER